MSLRSITVDGVRLEVDCRGSGSPPVAFVHGITGDLTEWNGVRGAMRADVMTVAHSRPGRGGSGHRQGDSPVTLSAMAAELKAVLDQAGAPAPRVLAGQSIGALIIAAYAAQWPDDVAGMVMVEPTHLRFWSLVADPGPLTDGPGGFVVDRDGSAAEHLALPPLPDVPTVVVSAAPDRWLGADPAEFNVSLEEMSRLWGVSQCEWAARLHAPRIEVDGVGHAVQKHAPAVVALAVDAVVEAARHGRGVVLDWAAVAAAGGRATTS